MKIISIEGNIGSGKSTLIKKLKEHHEFKNYRITFLPEPVDEWNEITDSAGITILEKYYSDQKRYAFSFQMMAYISRLKQLQQSVATASENSVIITERCLYTDRNIFAKMLYDSGMIEDIEYSIYLKWFDYFIDKSQIINFIYVRSDPDVCSDRIVLRNRKGETISILYLSNCHNYHENWLNNEKNVLVLDGNKNYSSEIPIEWIESIKKII
jgi:deoxyadenosine/deoxycytidine kinase